MEHPVVVLVDDYSVERQRITVVVLKHPRRRVVHIRYDILSVDISADRVLALDGTPCTVVAFLIFVLTDTINGYGYDIADTMNDLHRFRGAFLGGVDDCRVGCKELTFNGFPKAATIVDGNLSRQRRHGTAVGIHLDIAPEGELFGDYGLCLLTVGPYGHAVGRYYEPHPAADIQVCGVDGPWRQQPRVGFKVEGNLIAEGVGEGRPRPVIAVGEQCADSHRQELLIAELIDIRRHDAEPRQQQTLVGQPRVVIILVVGDDKEYGEGLDEIAHEFAVVADFLHFQYISVDIQCEGTDERFLEGVLIPDVGRPFPNDIEEPRDIFLHQTAVDEEENRHNLEVLLGVIDVSRLLQFVEKMLEKLRCGAVGEQFVGLNEISE